MISRTGSLRFTAASVICWDNFGDDRIKSIRSRKLRCNWGVFECPKIVFAKEMVLSNVVIIKNWEDTVSEFAYRSRSIKFYVPNRLHSVINPLWINYGRIDIRI